MNDTTNGASPPKTSTLTISGSEFELELPFREGPIELTAGMAAQMNQVYKENIRNNTAKAIDAMKAEGKSQEELQEYIDKYADEYEFGSRRSGGTRTTDPVLREARSLARQAVQAAFKAKGYTWSNTPEEDRNNLVDKHFENNKDSFMAAAKQRLEIAKATAATVDLV